MAEEKVCFEYGDGSYLEALVKDGKLIECPIIKISPPAEWGGAFTLDGAIDFLKIIKSAIKRTEIAAYKESER